MKILHVGFGFLPWRYGGLILYAEDLMDTQVAAGHDVAYFFTGRRYPVGPKDRLRKWTRRGVAMREIVSSTLVFGGERGTLTPQDDLSHPPSERHFERVLDELEPDVIHIQELIGLPTSLIELAGARGIPIVMTLHDYLTLCPVLKLYDVDGQICLRHDVGAQCARCSAGAPEGDGELVGNTVRYEVRHILGEKLAARVRRGMDAVVQMRRRRGRARPAVDSPAPPPPDRAAPPASYQARRDVNVERLNRIDAMIAQSHRVGEIYAQLGVDADRIRVSHSTLRSHEGIVPKAVAEPPQPVRFVTLNGCASVQKGRDVLIGALEILAREGLDGRFVLTVLGHATDETRARLSELPGAEYGGYYEPSRLQRVLEPYHVGIVPSIWEEVYGYVGIELIGAGLPVIGNARGGIVDYTRDGETGWVNRESSAEGLAEIMARIVRDPRQVVELNARIRERRDEILRPFDRHAAEVIDVYRAVIDGRGESSPDNMGVSIGR